MEDEIRDYALKLFIDLFVALGEQNIDKQNGSIPVSKVVLKSDVNDGINNYLFQLAKDLGTNLKIFEEYDEDNNTELIRYVLSFDSHKKYPNNIIDFNELKLRREKHQQCKKGEK